MGKPQQDSPKLQMEKWKNDAISFFNNKQYDLALITVNKALSLMTSLNIEDGTILNLAADVYRYNGDSRTALDYINRAILTDRDDPMNYLVKAGIEGDLENIAQKRNNLKIAISIADKEGFSTIKRKF